MTVWTLMRFDAFQFKIVGSFDKRVFLLFLRLVGPVKFTVHQIFGFRHRLTTLLVSLSHLFSIGAAIGGFAWCLASLVFVVFFSWCGLFKQSHKFTARVLNFNCAWIDYLVIRHYQMKGQPSNCFSWSQKETESEYNRRKKDSTKALFR